VETTGFQPPGAFITHLMKNGFKRYGPVNTVDDFDIYNLDLTSLQLDVGILVPFVIAKRLSAYSLINPETLGKVLPDLVNLAQKTQRKFVLLAVGGRLNSIPPGMVEDIGLSGIAIIDLSTIQGVLDTNDWQQKAKLLSSALVRFLGRNTLSPYVFGRPAIGGRFFGRVNLVKTMIPSAGNFTVVGNRRIGKTSLLNQIKEQLKLNNIRTGEVYGATCYSTVDVVYKLLQSLGRFREAEHVLMEPKRARNLAAYIHKIPEAEKTSVAVFIDEVDRILEFDVEQNWEVLHILRETFEGNAACRLFLAGFRKVIEARQSFESPAFNFTTPIELPLFSRQETFEMVTRPLERMGIAVTATDLPEAIYQETGGHPELIQIHCAAIVRFMQDDNRVPSAAELLSGVFNTFEHKRKVLGTLLANTNPHEELLCYLLMNDAERNGRTDNYCFKPHDVHRVLAAVGIKLLANEIGAIITSLKVSGIISPAPGKAESYRFSVPRLINYCVALSLGYCIEQAMARVKDQESAAARGFKSRKRSAIFEDMEELEQSKPHRPAIQKQTRTPIPSESITRIKNLTNQVKHIYLVPNGGAIVREAEAIENFQGTLDELTIDDLNNRCLDMVNNWTTQGIFEQRLRGIGKQLSDALTHDIPELIKHFVPASDRQQLIIVTDAEGLKIPFELLPHQKSNLSVNAAVARTLINQRLPTDVSAPFEQLITSLKNTTIPLRVLLLASDPRGTIPDAVKELDKIRKRIEAGCQQMELQVEFVEILPAEATVQAVEKTLLEERPFHLWHFTGHGHHFSEDADASGIVLTDDKDEPEVINCRRLSRWLKGSGLWLTYLSCCHTAGSSGSGLGLSQMYTGTMEAVVTAGVPNVVGFRWAVSDKSARHLADEFYRQIFEVQAEKNLSLAMLEARRMVEGQPDFFDAWASSMLITQYS
jgi:CHAT domain-containing protein